MNRGVSPVTAGESSSTTDARKAKRMKQSSTSMWTKPVVLNDQISREQPQCSAAPPEWLQWMAPKRGWYPAKAAGGAAKAPKGSQPKAPKQSHTRSCSEMESPFDFEEGTFCGVTQLCTRRPGHNVPPRPGPHWGEHAQAEHSAANRPGPHRGEHAQAEYSAANPANPLARPPQGVYPGAPPASCGVALGVPTGGPFAIQQHFASHNQQLFATQARPAPGGVAPGVPPGTPPDPHWLQGLLPFLGARPAFDTQQQQPFATQQQQLFATQQQQSAFTGGQTVSDPALQAVAAHHGLDAGFHSHAAGFHSLAPERHAVHAVPPNAPPAKYVPHTALPPPQSTYNDPGHSDAVADESILSLLVDDVMRDGSMDGLMHAVDMGEEVHNGMVSFELPCHPQAQPQPQTSSDDAVRAVMLALAKSKRQKAVELMAQAKEHEDTMMHYM